MKRIQSKNWNTRNQQNIIIIFDDRRFVLDDGIRTLADFHKGLRKQILTDNHK